MKRAALLFLLAGAVAAADQVPALAAEKLACSDEYAKLQEASLKMASPDLKPEVIEDVQKLLDEWQPKYDACVSAYGEAHGNDARADLEVKLAAGGGL